ncbi:hypothetical protein VNI00_005716 [Paramarasmius palmivorus]|uniref:Uncharacterized protein n=1 Tax=Paramarasmius palmivorus TaxID=297713 RepID=A0AAW0DD66_9AGAR
MHIDADYPSQNKFVMIKEHTVHLMTSEIHAANIPERRECQPTPVIEDRALDLDEAERTIATSGGIPFPVPNPTFLPDRLIKSLTPVFLIRHPGRVFPSFLRASTLIGATVAGGNASLYLSFKWQRIMFDFYKAWYSCPRGAESARPGRENLPIVIDGDKLIDDPQGQIRKMCQLLGLDPAPVQFSWEKKEKFESPAHEVFLSTIGKSTGVIKNKDSKPLNLEEEAAQWAKEWDKKTAQELKIRTEEAMEDYNYLLKESI